MSLSWHSEIVCWQVMLDRLP
ncbi:hypothetical protein MTR67_004014 [Solanum verrucosum]|uniref:Uncharacterized protein n=1 Tax=Solanum verrucosum TaxID=315347 RepID=A0AAF0TA63_SOLVR|nr:hypothetical protein MTR67_004014 [Solanum verrucosum]